MSVAGADSRWDVPTPEALKRIAREPLPLGVRASEPVRSFFRDVFFDTADLSLQARGVMCRIRHLADGRHQLMVSLLRGSGDDAEVTRAEAELTSANEREALEGESNPARMLQGIVNPSTLSAVLELETEHYTRTADAGLLRSTTFELEYDIVTVRAAGLSRSFQEIVLQARRRGRPTVEQLSVAMSEQYRLRSVSLDRRARGAQLQAALESEALSRNVGSGKWVAVIALDGPRVFCVADGDGVRLPVAEGSGEAACRHVMAQTLRTTVGELHLLTTVHGDGRLRSLEVWICTRVDRSATLAVDELATWAPVERLLAMVGTAAIQDAATLAALAVLAKSPELPRLVSLPSSEKISAEMKVRRPTPPPLAQQDGAAGPMLDGILSILAFNFRVLHLAEDPAVPLLERMRYLAIVSSNVDEFFSVQVGSQKHDGTEGADEGGRSGSAVDRMAKIGERTRELVARQAACAAECERLLAAQGIEVKAIGDVNPQEDEYLRGYFRSTVLPYLTPRAITATPGHSLPVIADQSLSLSVVLREAAPGQPLHLAELTIPTALPRFIPLPGSAAFVPLEELIRREVNLAYPGRRVQGAYLFRLTRYADLGLEEGEAGDLMQTIVERTQRRRHQPVVRMEIEPAMPAAVRDQLLRELQLEPGAKRGTFGPEDVYTVPGHLDLRAMGELADLPRPELHFAPFQARNPLADVEGNGLWERLRERDVLLHHPYDAFSSSVVRFFEDAANDPDVASIRVTLYRVGERSPIVEALLRAAAAGKDVTVFVEVKARFDEQRNVLWAKRLQAAGAHVVHGMRGFKNHSKIALVVRREADGPRRYAHIGTGNYNAGTARAYTDLGVLTSHAGICADVNDLFNTLTGSSVPTDVAYRECLVSPNALLTGLLARIEREAAHARAGRGGRIRVKVNGLADREVVQALYRAAQAGVEVDLVVRGICTLRPGVEGVSERIRVVGAVGRFLEHARIFFFENGGIPEYYIGSADLRPRNLRRRVEVLVPIHDPEHRARLDEILDVELNDPMGWELAADGSYARRRDAAAGAQGSAQTHFMAQADPAYANAGT